MGMMLRTMASIGLIGLCLLSMPEWSETLGLPKRMTDFADDAMTLFEEITGGTLEDVAPHVYTSDPDTHRNVSEIIRSRGYLAEEHDVVTQDGYILTVQRIVNPLVKPEYRNKLKPVIMQHGLFSSAADWVINSVQVKPEPYPKNSSDSSRDSYIDDTFDGVGDSQEHPNSLGFYLANRGYDVWLANSRGNIYGQRHVHMSSWNPKFWSFSFDEQIEFDLPGVIEYVQKVTGKHKVGYVGHSQGTVMGFGLLSSKPEYADVIEPFVALAPVAYVHHTISPVKYFAVYTPVFSHIDMWFGTSNVAVKYLAPLVCSEKNIKKKICANLLFLTTGFDEDELDEDRVAAYLNHTPSGTSVKNVAHYGQEIISRRFAHFDHGILGNIMKYGTHSPPDYDLSKIRSKSIALFIAENDWLAAPKDVARMRAELTVEPYYVFNVTTVKPKWNHIDFVYGKNAGTIINPEIYKIMEAFKND
ncbi:Gastric triacylglycerol lipase [Fragariocoptes setiger]|uniref:Gastric triacylglycerol lipase n=1 Tax=Fragariocoptes setiger TaxID=1670756 RepID=A0ABQ7SAC1_9ACAR|nr:Gastric triacylglycerol lipase [Fragariocoptes setiger]